MELTAARRPSTPPPCFGCWASLEVKDVLERKLNKEITATKIAIFRKREIRKTIYKNEWWFVVNDVVLALTDSPNVQDYIKKMRKRDNELSKGWGQIVTLLSFKTLGGCF